MGADIHVIGVDPGGTTGWARLTVPKMCVFGRQEAEIIDWECGEVVGSEVEQTRALAMLARRTQGMAYRVGPAVVIEDWTIMPQNVTTDRASLSPVRIGAMLVYAQSRREMDDSRIIFQDRSLAKRYMNDERLKAAGMYVPGSDHVRDATRHALTFLSRARKDADLRNSSWDS